MKKPIAIIFNDVHLKSGNENAVLKSIRHMIEVAKEKNIKRFIFAGDLFDSRSFQRLKVLNTFDTILSETSEAGIEMDYIPGNHDKSIYVSYDSFLDVYYHYPNFNLHRDISDITIDGIDITLLPFFSDDMLIPKIKEHGGGDVLISHFEMQGSSHLGKVSEKVTINEVLLSKWKKTYLGHYHNTHEITKNIVHLPSLLQANFGEDNIKGFSVLYDDLSYEIIRGEFREFIKIQIDLDSIISSELKQLIKTYENSSNTIRFEFTGSESKLKALDRAQFKNTGIDVKLNYDKKYAYDDSDIEIPTTKEKYNKSDISKIFKDFCEDKGYSYKEGQELLNEFLKHK